MTEELKIAAFTSANGLTARGLGERSADKTNALEFGADRLGNTDSLAGIQAAIDASFDGTIKRQQTYIPSGAYIISGPIFEDAPGNLRSSLSDPTIFNFSLSLMGDGGIGNYEGYGTRIYPQYSNDKGLWIGTGQNMHVGSIAINYPQITYLQQINTSQTAFAIAGGPGGASYTLLEKCAAGYAYNAFATGVNRDALADSNTWIKCVATSCVVGWNIFQTQNYINSLFDCRATECKVGVRSDTAKPVQVFGGNFSKSGGLYGSFAITSVSGLTPFSDTRWGTTYTNWSFTAVISSPDASMALGQKTMPDGTLGIGDYDRFAIETTSFGAIPLWLQSWDAGTSTATFFFYPVWLRHNYQSVDIAVHTAIQTELQAATALLAGELATTFQGSVHVHGAHLENERCLTQLLYGSIDFNSDPTCSIEDIYCDYQTPGDPSVHVLFVLQQVHPFIFLVNQYLTIERGRWGGGANGDGICIDLVAGDLTVKDIGGSYTTTMPPPNIRTFGYSDTFASNQITGAGRWDMCPFAATGLFGSADQLWSTNYGQSPFLGTQPAPWATPRITPAQLAGYSSLGAIGTYPALYGATAYHVDDYEAGVLTNFFARSSHSYLSYGQDITVDWSLKGGSTVIYLDCSKMRAGLKIRPQGLTYWYIVNGVYPTLGYVTVQGVNGAPTGYLEGDKDTTYTGSSIDQEAYSITQV